MIRGEIWWVDFGEPFGSEPGWRRPCLIIQNDSYNQSLLNTTIVIPLTTNLRLADFPGNYLLSTDETDLSKDSVLVTPQITVVDKARLIQKVSVLSDLTMREVSACIRLVLSL